MFRTLAALTLALSLAPALAGAQTDAGKVYGKPGHTEEAAGRPGYALTQPKSGPTPDVSDPSTRFATTDYVRDAQPCYDPRLSGVKWDGVTDDTAAMVKAVSAAISAAGNGAACVQLPKGQGKLAEVDLPAFPNGLRIIGAGEGATEILLASTKTDLFKTQTKVKNQFFDASQFAIAPPGVMGGGTSFTLNNIYAASIHAIKQFSGFNFVRCGTADYSGLTMQATSVEVHDTQTRNFKGTVIELGAGNEFRSFGNTYDTDSCDKNNASCQPLAFFVARNFSGIMLGNDDCIHCGNGFVFEPNVAGYGIEWTMIDNTQADTSAGAGWIFHAANGGRIKSVHATKLWSSSNANDGVKITQDSGGFIDDLSFVQPFVFGNDGVGIHFTRFDGMAYVVAPSISGNSKTIMNVNSGIFAEAGAGFINITGGHIGTMLGFGDWQKYNVEIGSNWNGSLTISNSNLCGFATGPFNEAGSSHFGISQTACVNPGGTATIDIGPSPFIYTASIAPTSFNIFGGSGVNVTVNGILVCTLSPCFSRAEPGQTIAVNYSKAPNMVITRD
jgi:hypothetical protein